MTYDERREIAEWIDIVKRNCERTLRSIENLQDALGKIPCTLGPKKNGKNGNEADKTSFR